MFVTFGGMPESLNELPVTFHQAFSWREGRVENKSWILQIGCDLGRLVFFDPNKFRKREVKSGTHLHPHLTSVGVQ